jgi:dTDP-4-amino-4,6-dideoxygalactose transaminase
MVTTQDTALARRLQLLRSHGMTRELSELEDCSEGAWYYEQTLLGYNYRLTDLQAALGHAQLRRLDRLHAERCARADRYDRLLAKLPLTLPPRDPDKISAWHLYAIEIDPDRCAASRASVFAALRAQQIGVNVHYIPIHLQPYYRRLGFAPGDFPAAEHFYRHAISLPLFPAMTDAQQDRVVDVLSAALSG